MQGEVWTTYRQTCLCFIHSLRIGHTPAATAAALLSMQHAQPGSAISWPLYSTSHHIRYADDALSFCTSSHVYVCVCKPAGGVQVAGALWATAWIGSFLTLWWGVLLGYIAAFTVPVTYQALKPSLEAVGRTIRAHTMVRPALGVG